MSEFQVGYWLFCSGVGAYCAIKQREEGKTSGFLYFLYVGVICTLFAPFILGMGIAEWLGK
jgi:hypothetical protein